MARRSLRELNTVRGNTFLLGKNPEAQTSSITLMVFVLIAIIFISAPVRAVEKMQIAVLDLEPKGVSKIVAGVVSDILRSEMVKTGYFTVVERGQMDAILKEQGFQMTGCTDQACAVQYGKILSAKKILIGEINMAGMTFLITIRIVDVETGVAEFAADGSAENEDMLTETGVNITKKLLENIYEENKDYFTPPLTRKGYYFRSILPGWGQIYADHRQKGYLFMGSFVLAAGFAGYGYMDYTKTLKDYKAVPRGAAQSEFESRHDAMVRAAQVFTIGAGFAAAVYLAHWIDVLFYSKPEFAKKTALYDANERYIRFNTTCVHGSGHERIVYGSLVTGF
jgi:hypothetical protein